MGFINRVSEGLSSSRTSFKERINILLKRGPHLDDDFWDGLEETLILSDIGAPSASLIVEKLQDQARRKALPDAYAVLDMLNFYIADSFTAGGSEILSGDKSLILFVGINGTGKTTTVGKIAKEQHDLGRNVILGSADTFRAAAIEQLEAWAERACVETVSRERGSDPASVCYDTIERAEATDANLVLIDTAGRLHTSKDLMRELEKIVDVVRKRSGFPVYIVLVIDATTGQNGLAQAREFNTSLDLDAIILTKLDGTAKGGIALAISHELELPLIKIGVGEGLDDLRDFDPYEFASSLVGTFDDRFSDMESGPDAISELPQVDLMSETEEERDALHKTHSDFDQEPLSNLEVGSEPDAESVQGHRVEADNEVSSRKDNLSVSELLNQAEEESDHVSIADSETEYSPADVSDTQPQKEKKKHWWDKYW